MTVERWDDDRLDRFAASIEEGFAKVRQLTDSNAKAIQALSDQAAEERRARSRLYQSMADLAAAQSGFYQKLEAQDELISTLSRRQGEIVQILKVLSDRSQ
jgi:hypothetical protein